MNPTPKLSINQAILNIFGIVGAVVLAAIVLDYSSIALDFGRDGMRLRIDREAAAEQLP